jgi:molecular chaperone GrpE
VPEELDSAETGEWEVAEDANAAPDAEPPSLAAALTNPPEGSLIQPFEQRARLAEDRLAEVLAAFRQLKADQESQRERMTHRIERRSDQRHERLLVKFIDILDSFDRALEAAETTYAGAPLIEGLILVRTQLLQTLRDEGLERIPVLGLTFDPHVSEAMSTEPVSDPDQHHVVVKEYQRGYRFKGRLVRPSRVVVGEFSPASAEPQPAEKGDGVTAEPQTPAVYDHAEPLEPVPDDRDPAPEVSDPSSLGVHVTPVTEDDDDSSVEDIVARVAAQAGAFDEEFDAASDAPQKPPPETE